MTFLLVMICARRILLAMCRSQLHITTSQITRQFLCEQHVIDIGYCSVFWCISWLLQRVRKVCVSISYCGEGISSKRRVTDPVRRAPMVAPPKRSVCPLCGVVGPLRILAHSEDWGGGVHPLFPDRVPRDTGFVVVSTDQ